MLLHLKGYRSSPCQFAVAIRNISQTGLLMLAQSIDAVGQSQQAFVDVCTVTQLLTIVVGLGGSLTARKVYQGELAHQHCSSILVPGGTADHNL